jgi:uncharacterized protein YecE (DUF72 family)
MGRTNPTPGIGCAGWSIASGHRARFGAGDSMLARYATRFDVVEVNTSFYRAHRNDTYRRWAASVPAHFRFSIKLPREISHERGLRDCGAALDRLLGEVQGLGDRLGGFLLQMPPRLALDARSASAFFRAFRRRSDAPLVCEPRHPSWFSPRADALLARLGISRAAADPARVPAAARPDASARWPYWRWHGSPRMYYSDYPAEALRELKAAVEVAAPAPLRPWVIFDNTAHGFAIANALALQQLFGRGHHHA